MLRNLLLAIMIFAMPALAQTPNCPPTDAGGTGSFHVQNGQILDPSGKPFIARGINVWDSSLGDAQKILAMFPGINFIRLPVFSYRDPSAYASFIQTMTAHGTVIELEDHQTSDGSNSGGAQGVVFTGDLLAKELAWYHAVAKAYAGNPYVWFGTNNEPAGSGSALSQWQRQTYQAIRGARNNSPVMIETYHWFNLNPSAYADMTNIIWDPHFYGPDGSWQSTRDKATALKEVVTEAQKIRSADGLVPVIIGEYGPDCCGHSGDTATVAAVINAGSSGLAGSAAWVWEPGNGADALTVNYRLTVPYGRMVQIFIGTNVVQRSACTVDQRAAAAKPSLTITPAPTLAPVTVPSGLNILTPGHGTATTSDGARWTIDVHGCILRNGIEVDGGCGTAALEIVDNRVYALDGSGKGWFYWTGQWWSGSEAPA